VVLTLLLAASAGARTKLGRLALLAALASAGLAWSLFRPVAPAQALLAANGYVAAVAALGLLGRRRDTRLIALLCAGAAALPLALSLWTPGGSGP
jgi:hypothetical protein